MKTVIIIQARMSSSRLPGKILKNVLNKPLLEYQIDRLRRVKLVDQIVVATTINDKDVPIVELCDRLCIPYYRGSEADVLSRYHDAATSFHAEVVVRVTSDCPLIDPEIVDKVIKFYCDHSSDLDYVSNCLVRSYPRGMDTEVFPFRILDETFNEAVEASDREHVTPFIYRYPQRYRLANVSNDKDDQHHRWTVDTPEDFELIKLIIEALYPEKPEFGIEDVLNLFKKESALFWINAFVKQKKLGH